jgi:hypothetical protein
MNQTIRLMHVADLYACNISAPIPDFKFRIPGEAV